MKFTELFNKKPIIGMVHLLPLPSSPLYAGNLEAIEKRAIEDVKALLDGGIDAFIVENFGDVPYDNTISLEAYSVMLSITNKIKQMTHIPFGLNIQYNCIEHEWSMAYASKADFIRVESFVENRIGTHGISYASAPKLMRMKQQYPADCMIFSDINVKHTYPMAEIKLEDAAHEAIESGSNAIIITGKATGQNPKIEDVKELKEKLNDIPLLIGSGVNAKNVNEFLQYADGIIVGSSLKVDGDVYKGIDPIRVKEFMNIVKGNQTF